MDTHADGYRAALVDTSLAFLRNLGAPLTPLGNGLVPLDAGTTPFDNSSTRKQGVSLTYKGHDGLAPLPVYLGQEGWCLELEMREGRQHSQDGTPALLLSYPRLAAAKPAKGCGTSPAGTHDGVGTCVHCTWTCRRRAG
jgi:hypothetical protein